MTLFMPRKVVSNWYRYDASFSYELMASFVDGIEKQAELSILNYVENRKCEVVENDAGADYFQSLMFTHQGLDNESWDLDGIFREHFPSLQRRSALLTLCSYFEYELEQLCLLYQREKKFGLAPYDLHGTGIDRSANYLEKVAGLNLTGKSQEWTAIKRIQTIRNVIVHEDGKLQRNGNVTDKGKKIIGFMKEMKFLRGDDEIVLDKGFLSDVLDTYRKYFQLIAESIKASESLGKEGEEMETWVVRWIENTKDPNATKDSIGGYISTAKESDWFRGATARLNAEGFAREHQDSHPDNNPESYSFHRLDIPTLTEHLERCIASQTVSDDAEGTYASVKHWLVDQEPDSKDELFKRAQCAVVDYVRMKSK